MKGTKVTKAQLANTAHTEQTGGLQERRLLFLSSLGHKTAFRELALITLSLSLLSKQTVLCSVLLQRRAQLKRECCSCPIAVQQL